MGQDAFENLQKYKFLKDGVGITTVKGMDSILRSGHDCNAQYVSSVKRYNRGGKRDNTIMVTGDLPCFAQMRTYPQNTLNPDIYKLGDCRLKITYNSKTFWIDSLKDIITEFYPGITTYKIKIPQLNDITFDVSVFQAGNWGIAAKLEISNSGSKSENIRIEWNFGGLRKCGRTFDAVYFYDGEKEEAGNKISLTGSNVIISDTSIIDKVGVTTIPKVKPVLLNNRALFARDFVSGKSQKQSFYLITSYNKDSIKLLSQLEINDPEITLLENKKYYDKILSAAVISTPNRLIDCGLRTAMINLDNVFTDSAWLEGVQRWSAYFTNLFQLPASISLGQNERAKNALIFYNPPKLGPAPAMRPDKSPEEGTEDDGLDYYIYALIQYINLTGDTAFLNKIWPDVMRAFKRIMLNKDPDGDRLLFWNFGCNIFLYQADMLGMPGKSASPSIMTSGMMEKLSAYAQIIGKHNDAEWLKKTSGEIKAAVMSGLWNNSEGCFYNHIDLQNISHLSHYYTDHIFSTLYSSIDTFINWQSLYYLEKTLIEKDPCGRKSLMKVGTLKGRLFGNDNIMPTQMAEAARAFYKTGDKERATLFLESVARAGTIFTEGPGTFPERMNDLGKGEANYLFGNPIGSFIHSTINGLFGLEITNLGQTLQWQPGFPDNWDHAKLKLPYVNVSYKMKNEGQLVKASYIADYPVNRSLHFSLFLPPCKIQMVRCNGKAIEYKNIPGLNRTELKLKAEPAMSHNIELIYSITGVSDLREMSVVEGSLNTIRFNQPVDLVRDPQSILKISDIVANILKFKAGNKTGNYEFFVRLHNPDYYIPVKLKIIPEFQILCDTAFYNISDNSLLAYTKVFINKNSKNKYTIESTISDIHQKQTIGNNAGGSLKLIFKEVTFPFNSIGNINFKISDENGQVFEVNKKIVIKGIDEISNQTILKKRMNITRSIDISPFFNATSYLNMFPWGRDEISFNILFAGKGETLNTRYGNFTYIPSSKTVALIESGRSDIVNRQTIPTIYSDKVEIPVGANTSELDLLYFSEVESRNTGTVVGKITLFYANNDTAIIPLVVGKNMDFVRSYIARDAFPLFVSENLDKIVSYSAINNYDKCCSKHLNFLPLLCDKKRFLKSIQISIDAADAQFGLIGINYLNN